MVPHFLASTPAHGHHAVPLFVIAAGIAVLAAYWLSRHRSMARLGISFAGFSVTHLVLRRLDAGVLANASDLEKSVLRFGASDDVLIITATIVVLISIMVCGFEPRDRGRDTIG